jgi:hypothetical protein
MSTLFEKYWADLVLADKVPSIGPIMSAEEKLCRAVLAQGVPAEPSCADSVEWREWLVAAGLYAGAFEYLCKRRREFYRVRKACAAASEEQTK